MANYRHWWLDAFGYDVSFTNIFGWLRKVFRLNEAGNFDAPSPKM